MSCLPGSVSSCDAFLNVFQSHGLKPEVICPCASSPEAMTVAIRRFVAHLVNVMTLLQVKYLNSPMYLPFLKVKQ